MPKTIFIDTSRCTACRGCQMTCKEWNELPANKTKQVGTHQNPQDLNPNNYKLVRFSEHLENGVISWNFFPDQCRHCTHPPCKGVADVYLEGAVLHDQNTGAVLFTEKTRELSAEDFEEVRAACPYDIPRRNEATSAWSKCTMCYDRVVNGRIPVCVKTCPTGAMNFGERAEMLALAEARLKQMKARYPKAVLADPADVLVIYLMTDDPKKFHSHSVAEAREGKIDRKDFLATLAKPVQGAWKEITKS
jgi:formate dehydrogenase iron-sulfur subunit